MSYYYEEETVDINDIFNILTLIETTNPAQYRQLYTQTIYQFLYDISLYLPYFPQGTFNLFESNNLTIYIKNQVIQATYNGQLIVGLTNIAQIVSQLLNYDFSLLYSFLSAVYYNLNEIAQQIVPPDNVKQYLQNLYALLVSKA